MTNTTDQTPEGRKSAETILNKAMRNQNAESVLYRDNGQHGALKDFKRFAIDAMTEFAKQEVEIACKERDDKIKFWQDFADKQLREFEEQLESKEKENGELKLLAERNKERLIEIGEYFLTISNKEDMTQSELEIFLSKLIDKVTENLNNYNSIGK